MAVSPPHAAEQTDVCRVILFTASQVTALPPQPQQPGYHKRLRGCAGLVLRVIRALAADTTLWTDDVWVVDSTPVECGRSRDTARRSDLAGWAEYGYCGLPLPLLLGAAAAPAVHPGRPARRLRAHRRPKPTNARRCWASSAPTRAWSPTGPVRFSSGTRTTTAASSRPPWTRPGSGVLVRVLQRILALTAAIWHNDRTRPTQQALPYRLRSLTPWNRSSRPAGGRHWAGPPPEVAAFAGQGPRAGRRGNSCLANSRRIAGPREVYRSAGSGRDPRATVRNCRNGRAGRAAE